MNPIYSNTLEELIYDCGGPAAVARELGIKVPSLWEWVEKGRLPWTDLDGRTDYSETLARMQRSKRMTPIQIRRLGLRV